MVLSRRQDTASRDTASRDVTFRDTAFRSAAGAFFCEQVFEQSIWVAVLLYAFERNGTKSAGIITSAILVIATVVSPLQSRLLERFAPFASAQMQLATLTISALGITLSLALGATPAVSWLCILVAMCAQTSGPSVLFALIPSTARSAASLAQQNVVYSWIESAALIIGPITAALVLSMASTVEDGLMIVTLIGAVLSSTSWLLLHRHAAEERHIHESAGRSTRDLHRHSVSVLTERQLVRVPAIRTLMIITLGSYLTIGSLDVLFVPLAQGAGIGGERAGYIAASYGLGGLVALLFARRIAGRVRLVLPLCCLAGMGSLALVMVAFLRSNLAAVLILMATSGAFRAVFGALRRVLVQRSSPAGALLRVAGLFQVVITLGYAIGALVPWLAGSTLRACVATGSLLPVSIVLVTRSLRRVDDEANVPVTEIALLSQVGILKSLRPESLEALARQSECRSYTDGTAIVTEGDVGAELFVVVDGSVEVIKQGDHIRVLRRGDVFGEIALLRNQTRSATVVAVERAQVLSVPGTAFLELVGLHTGVADAVEGLISQRP